MARTPRNWENIPGDNTSRHFTRKWIELAYAATIAFVAAGVSMSYVVIAELAGALTINAATDDLADAKDFDEFIFFFTTDGTQRIVTFGTNFLSSGTLTIPADKGAVVRGIYDEVLGAIRITSREIHA